MTDKRSLLLLLLFIAIYYVGCAQGVDIDKCTLHIGKNKNKQYTKEQIPDLYTRTGRGEIVNQV
jgi:hypothetical protein